MSREVAQAERVMDQQDVAQVEEGLHLEGQFDTAGSAHRLQDTASGSSSHPGKPVTDNDQVFWFWESVFTTAGINFCPKKHAEAMVLPQAGSTGC